jgi:hypothetical protein
MLGFAKKITNSYGTFQDKFGKNNNKKIMVCIAFRPPEIAGAIGSHPLSQMAGPIFHPRLIFSPQNCTSKLHFPHQIQFRNYHVVCYVLNVGNYRGGWSGVWGGGATP